jgi:hypothetical protein
MPSKSWQTLGTGNILGYLRADMKRASSSAWVMGPWIDAFFANVLIESLPAALVLRVVTRPLEGASPSFAEHALGARECLDARPHTATKLLANLHAKVIIFDDELVYCGSANWYRYSLEDSREIVLRGSVSDAKWLLDEMQVIWEQAVVSPQLKRTPKRREVTDGYSKEVIDPLAEAKLKEVPGSFVLRAPPRGSKQRR